MSFHCRSRQAAHPCKWLAFLGLFTVAICSRPGLSATNPLTASQAHWLVSSTQPACAAGQNDHGELGDGTAVNRFTPVPAVDSSFTQVSTSWFHSLGLKSDGTVWAWGYNGNGELGNGTTFESPTPVPVPGLSGVIAVAAGQWHSLALKKDGTVWAWGLNGNGRLGNGTTNSSTTPVQVINLTGVTAIAAGQSHSLALTSNGMVWGWGYNGFGQLGNGIYSDEPSPVQVTALNNVSMIAAGANHSLSLKNDGTVWTWGYNGQGQLGDGDTNSSPTIVRASNLTGVSSIAGGDNHSLASKSDGTVWAWGYNASGQLGNGTLTQELTPTEVPNFGGAIGVAGGTSFSVVLKNNGTIWAWGDNTYGQLADGSTTASVVPVQSSACPAPYTNPTPAASLSKRVSASQYFSLAVENDGSVEGFGQNVDGQLGDGTTINRSSPVKAAGLSSIIGVAAGWHHSLAVRSDGTVWAWGYNGNGELGTGSTSSSPTPLQIPGLKGFIAVAAGQWHSLGLKNDGTVWAWGFNGNGRLGDGSTTGRLVPVQVIGLTGIVAIAAGESHSLALKNDGTVWSWGYNGSGQLGNGTTVDQTSAVQVALLDGVTGIAGGANHSLATLKTGGTVWAWGYNGNGELGDGSFVSRPYIVRASGLTNVSDVAGGDYYSLAVKTDGTVWAFGSNNDGELGNGSTVSTSVPVPASNLNGVLTVAAGTAHSVALEADGTISAWGLNSFGEFGQPSPASTTVPISTSVAGLGPFYRLSASASPSDGGTIRANPSSSDGYYQVNTRVCLSVSANPGYTFSGWSGTPLDGAGCLTLTANASVQAHFTQGLNALRFVPVTPCRIADTRDPNGPFGGPALSAGSTRDFTVPHSACNIPAGALAFSLNVTVIPVAHLQYLTVWPAGQQQPDVSTLNSFDGRIKANAAVLPAGNSGAVSVYATDATNVILDIDGYFVSKTSNASALGFYPVKPCRIADTRSGSGPLGPPALVAGEDRTFPILSSACGLPASAKAYSLNFTVVPKKHLGFLTVWPAGENQPNVSTLNAPTGAVTANAAIVPAGSSGSVDVFASDDTDLIVDVNGYFAAPAAGALSLYNLTPCRVLDTRNPPGSKPFAGTKTVNVTAVTACAVPAAAQAMVFNATVVPPGPLDYLTLWAAGQTEPVVSTLNALDGAVTSNLAIVPAKNGSIDAFASNPTQLILDISSYFAP